ncbi:MAG: sigma factor-like helix-turn-helix DNA-binding protein [Chloroflexota bacterium]
MNYEELTPEEKLYHAIFGLPSEIKHFLTPEGIQALTNALEILDREHKDRGKVLRLRFGIIPVTNEEITKRRERRKRHSTYDEKCILSPCRTLSETAKYFNVTRERIHQVETKMLRYLRHRNYSTKLKPYLER